MKGRLANLGRHFFFCFCFLLVRNKSDWITGDLSPKSKLGCPAAVMARMVEVNIISLSNHLPITDARVHPREPTENVL